MRYEVAEADQKDQIVITLHESEGSDLCVRSVDVFAAPMKVRVSAQTQKGLESVFHREIAEMIRRMCEAATLAKQIINVPDFTLRFRGLAIKGYTLLVHTMENGLRQFIVRLKRGIGNALALFKPWGEQKNGLSVLPISGQDGVNSDRLFDEMLSHLYLPLVNLNNFLKNALESRSDHASGDLATSVVQLKTKAEVLQFAFDRLISEMMLEKYTRAEPDYAQDQFPMAVTDQSASHLRA